VEIATGLSFALSYLYFGPTLQLLTTALYASLFLVIGMIDLEHRLILNKITLPSALTVLLIDFFVPPPGITEISSTWNGILSGVIGAVIGLTFLLIIYLVSFAIYKQEAMGLGDVKLAALIGLVVGSRLVLFSLLMGALLGGLVASGLLLFRIKGRKETIPFGSFLSLATIISLFWGNQILDWYLRLYGL
jgi:prepilin signal peptidase PulO-like enzyme (type II secretory pathway)